MTILINDKNNYLKDKIIFLNHENMIIKNKIDKLKNKKIEYEKTKNTVIGKDSIININGYIYFILNPNFRSSTFLKNIKPDGFDILCVYRDNKVGVYKPNESYIIILVDIKYYGELKEDPDFEWLLLKNIDSIILQKIKKFLI